MSVAKNRPPNQTPAPLWRAGRYVLTWTVGRPLIMGIVNITPDSFSDGGQHTPAQRIAHAERLVHEGAQLLDFGAESTRPGALPVDEATEWQRLEPVLREVVRWGIPISVDTMKPAVMQKALDIGVDVLNDVNAFRAPGALDVLAKSACGAVVMHMQGEPRTMQQQAQYTSVCQEVSAFLSERVNTCQSHGIKAERILLDPGLGFGKTLAHNLDLLRHTAPLQNLAAGVLVGASRKRFIGELTEQAEPSQRVAGSLAVALYAAEQGAAVLRVHDVRATFDALMVWGALHGTLPLPSSA